MLGLLNKIYGMTKDKEHSRIHEFICILNISVCLFFISA